MLISGEMKDSHFFLKLHLSQILLLNTSMLIKFKPVLFQFITKVVENSETF